MTTDFYRDLPDVCSQGIILRDGINSSHLEVLKSGGVGAGTGQLITTRSHEVNGQAVEGLIMGVSPGLTAGQLCDGDSQI